MDIALERALIYAMGQPFDGEICASLLSLGLRDSGSQVAALLQFGDSNSASEPASEGQRNARSRCQDGALLGCASEVARWHYGTANVVKFARNFPVFSVT
jgi:hypothetical protein